MTCLERQQLLKRVEDDRGSRVIAYVLSDREPPFQAKMALDVILPFYEHLVHIGRNERIDLLIYGLGGDTIVPWRLVNLIREYCQEFTVLVPYKAHSALTLLALGADSIVMGALGELSPIDPSISTPFNPPNPGTVREPKIEISVEDVVGFINLARERATITDQDNLVKVLDRLSEHIHPLTLGAVYRTHALIRLLASKLLHLHMVSPTDAQRIPRIVDDLAEKLYYHNYLICRNEASDLGLNVVKPSSTLETLLWDLYSAYALEMDLGKAFDPAIHLQSQQKSEIEKPIAMIESYGLCSTFRKRIRMQLVSAQPGQPQPPFPQIAIQEQAISWQTRKSEEGK